MKSSERMKAEESDLDRFDLEVRALKWYGHVQRMFQERWPKRIFQLFPLGRRKHDRPRISWRVGVTGTKRTRNLGNDH
ncbi:hypothetical protein ANN_20756 [Periplaneta americana]|uniref:Uncharacterized protein n=1 Tax=Periplaneta americana TaxID=6978 RepID=A0ABQ8SE93_PERAM|nr:hypothetical protein ANN_20756 [Periplaneta americana]